MDVRCEKCQTEYELDESRLKPGGVTVKCTNCGHMFKIRKRAPTNVGLPAQQQPEPPRPKPPSAPRPAPAPAPRVESEAPMSIGDVPSGPNDSGERQWLVRLENGETKTCRELAALQQWIVAGVVTRESLISRTGKTWKRLGDIGELGQYFTIADEARAQRSAKPTGTPAPPTPASTIMGMGAVKAPTPEEEELEARSTGNYRARPSTPPAPTPAQTTTPRANPIAQTELAPSGPLPVQEPERLRPPSNVPGGRATAAWAN